jgi:hypothetical protein
MLFSAYMVRKDSTVVIHSLKYYIIRAYGCGAKTPHILNFDTSRK